MTSTDCVRDTTEVGTEAGHHCAATAYAVHPAAPTTTASTSEVTYACQGPASPDGTCLATLHPQQFTAFGFGALLVVLLLAALVVAQLRRPRA